MVGLVFLGLVTFFIQFPAKDPKWSSPAFQQCVLHLEGSISAKLFSGELGPASIPPEGSLAAARGVVSQRCLSANQGNYLMKINY